jgi:hypothetical protein
MSRRVSPRGLGDSSRKEKIALRSTAAPIKYSEFERKICAGSGCRPGTMLLIEYFVPFLLAFGISKARMAASSF